MVGEMPKEIFEALLNAAKDKKRAFVESVDLAIRISGVDSRKSDQQIKGALSLPCGYGKKARVAVFVDTEFLPELTNAGADVLGDKRLVDEIRDGRICDFDWVITTLSFAPHLVPIAKVLGKKDLMPGKYGGIVRDVAAAIEDFHLKKVKYKADKGGVVHVKIGNVEFSPEDLETNFRFVLKTLLDTKPESVKTGKKGKGGSYFRSIFASSTMGNSFKIENYSVNN